MKYEEIKIGDVFTYLNDEEIVISKSDEYRIITTIDSETIPTTWKEKELHMLKLIRKESILDKVTNAVKDITDFTIEETESGVIILTPIKK